MSPKKSRQKGLRHFPTVLARQPEPCRFKIFHGTRICSHHLTQIWLQRERERERETDHKRVLNRLEQMTRPGCLTGQHLMQIPI